MSADPQVAQHAATVVLNLGVAVVAGAGISMVWLALLASTSPPGAGM